jgi:hypothetical protein
MRRVLPLALVAALLTAALLTGCGGSQEESAAVAIAKSGVLGALGETLKHDDDAAEVAELHAQAETTTPEERVEAREAAERSAMEAAEPASAVRPAEFVSEGS